MYRFVERRISAWKLPDVESAGVLHSKEGINVLVQMTLRPVKLLLAICGCLGLLIAPSISAQEISAQPVSASQDQSLSQAMSAYQANEYDQAISIANAVLKGNPKHGHALHIRASSRVELGIQTGNAAMIRDGVADARSSIEAISPKVMPEYYLSYLFGMTNLAMIEGQDKHAQDSINVATQVIDHLELPPEHRASILYQRGLAHLQIDDTIDQGISDFKAALNLAPKHIPSLTAIADTYAMSDKNEEALVAFNKFVEVYPELPTAHNNRGMHFKQLGRKQDALNDFASAIKLEPKFFVGHINHGYILMEMGRAAEAESDFTTALALQPGNSSVLGLRANVRLRQGNAEAAIADYKRAIEIYPKNPMSHANLGFAYFYVKKYDEAYQSFDQAININGKMRFLNPWTYASMILSGKGEQANSRFAEVVAKPVEERDWIDLLTLYLMGKVDENSLLASVNPEDEKAATAQRCEGYFFVGLRTSAAGSPDQAKAYFAKSLETDASYLSAYRAVQFELQKFQK